MSTSTQRSFAGGEISPSLYSRVDTTKYATSARTLRNMIVMRHGGTTNRPGTTIVGEVKDSTKPVRLIEFIFNNDQTYVLEFGDKYMRVIKNGAYVFLSPVTISGITQASQGVFTATAHGFSNGDTILVTGVAGMTQVNGRYLKVSDVTTNTFKAKTLDGNYLNTSGFSAYSSGGAGNKIFELLTAYAYTDLSELRYTQSADVMTFTHPSYNVQELSRLSDTNWAISAVFFQPHVTTPSSLSSAHSGGTGVGQTNQYVVTQVDLGTGEESWPAVVNTFTISSVTTTYPIVVTTTAAHGLVFGQLVQIAGCDMFQLNNRFFYVVVLSTTTFQLQGESGVGRTAGTTGSALVCGTVQFNVSPFSSGGVNTLAWTRTVPQFGDGKLGVQYNIYRADNLISRFGFIGVVNGANGFTDTGYTPDFTNAPPLASYDLMNPDNMPSAVTYSKQRRFFAGPNSNPQSVLASRIALFYNFSTHSPIQSDDAIAFSLVGRQVNSIKHLVEVGPLMIFTSAGEHVLLGDASGAVTPTNVNVKQVSYNGSGSVRPLVVNSGAIYVQARGSIVRELRYNEAFGLAEGESLTDYAMHLVTGRTIVSWAYQQVPHSIVWAVCSDGAIIGITYNKDQQILAWHHHDTAGMAESICAIPEGIADAIYVTIVRTINGRQVRYIERLSTRDFTDSIDGIFSDASMTFDGRNTDATKTLRFEQVSGGGWAYTSPIDIFASSSIFSQAWVGDEVHFLGNDGTQYRIKITSYISATNIRGMPADSDIPVERQSMAFSAWSRATANITGLWHLEGMAVSVAGDCFVLSSPYNSDYPTLTVSSGSITLSQACAVTHVGLPYVSDLETLDIDTAQGETLADKKKNLSKVTLHVENTRGLFVGGANPDKAVANTANDPLYGLYEIKARDFEHYDQAVKLATGKLDLVIRSEWNSNGRIFIRQVDPVPASVLAVSPAGFILGGSQ